MRHVFRVLLGIWLLGGVVRAQETVTIFASASATNAIAELAKTYEKTTGVKILSSFASASTLAKQIEHGAPADIFLSADQRWMDYLVERKLVQVSSQKNLLTNELVIIAPKAKPFKIQVEPSFNFAGAFTSRLAIGDPTNVPAGMYAKEAFMVLGWWEALASRLAPVADVRAALRLVETDEVDVGVVYRTDAQASSSVTILAAIPNTYLKKPVVYPIALTATAGLPAAAFVTFISGAEGKKIFTSSGFGWATD